MRKLFVLVVLSLIFHKVQCQDNSYLKEFKLLEGKWVGKSETYYPRDSSKEKRIEEVQVECQYILKATYMECKSKWTDQNENTRDLRIYFTYNSREKHHDILFLYDNWPGKVNYPLYYDSLKNKFTGSDNFISSGNIKAMEKVEWFLDEKENKIISREYNHFENESDTFWPKTFEFTWQKVE